MRVANKSGVPSIPLRIHKVSLLSLNNHVFLPSDNLSQPHTGLSPLSAYSAATHVFPMTISLNHTFLPNDKSLKDDSHNKPANAQKKQ